MLKREGLVISHKRTERLYSEEGLVLRRKRRRKGAAGSRVMMPAAQRLNQRWSMDFVTDSIPGKSSKTGGGITTRSGRTVP
jgi:putative transposase